MNLTNKNKMYYINRIYKQNNLTAKQKVKIFEELKKQMIEKGIKYKKFLELRQYVDYLYSRVPKTDLNRIEQCFTGLSNVKNNLVLHAGLITVSCYINSTSCKSFPYSYGIPSKEILKTIQNNMIYIDNDSIYFEIIEFENNYHLYAKYNQIIGSRLLAILDK